MLLSRLIEYFFTYFVTHYKCTVLIKQCAFFQNTKVLETLKIS